MWACTSFLNPARPPETMGEVFDRLSDLPAFSSRDMDAGLARRLRQAVGFRNVAVHGYAALDWVRC